MRQRLSGVALACILLGACSSNADTIKSDVSKKEVETVELVPTLVRIPFERKAALRFEDGSLDGYTLSEYRPDGRLKKKQRYSASAILQEETSYIYEEALLTEIIRSDEKGHIHAKTRYSYKGLDPVSESVEDVDGRTLMSFRYGYDEKKRKISQETYSSSGKKLASNIYSWQDSLLIKTVLQDASERTISYSTFTYDADARPIRQDFYKASGSLVRSDLFEYERGRVTKQIRIDFKGNILFIYTYEYGDLGEVLKKYIEDFEAESKYSYTYEYTLREEERMLPK